MAVQTTDVISTIDSTRFTDRLNRSGDKRGVQDDSRVYGLSNGEGGVTIYRDLVKTLGGIG